MRRIHCLLRPPPHVANEIPSCEHVTRGLSNPLVVRFVRGGNRWFADLRPQSFSHPTWAPPAPPCALVRAPICAPEPSPPSPQIGPFRMKYGRTHTEFQTAAPALAPRAEVAPNSHLGWPPYPELFPDAPVPESYWAANQPRIRSPPLPFPNVTAAIAYHGISNDAGRPKPRETASF